MVLAVGASVGLAGAASAHDVLISSDPADNATVATAPSSLQFTFDQPVQNFDPVVSLVGPDGRQYATGTPSVSGNVVSGTVDAGPAGRYTAAYRIVSADGHPVTGEIHFTLAGDGAASGRSHGRPGRRRDGRQPLYRVAVGCWIVDRRNRAGRCVVRTVRVAVDRTRSSRPSSSPSRRYCCCAGRTDRIQQIADY